MRKRIVKTATVVSAMMLIALGGASVAKADQRILAKVPFAFMAGDVRMPAGDYVVSESSEAPGVASIASADGRQFTYALTIPSSTVASSAQPELVFERLADQYVLTGILPVDGDSREIVVRRDASEPESSR